MPKNSMIKEHIISINLRKDYNFVSLGIVIGWHYFTGFSYESYEFGCDLLRCMDKNIHRFTYDIKGTFKRNRIRIFNR